MALNAKSLCALVCAAFLVACGADEQAAPNIADIAEVQSSFGPEFRVDSFSSGIDPQALGQPTLPAGTMFQPAECQNFVTASVLPSDLQGNMAAVFAEGEGNRFIAIAVETSAPVPVNQPTEQCRQVGFAAGALKGVVEVVEAPQIEGVATLGTYRVYQTMIDGRLSSGKLYNYIASFENYQVMVTANPLVVAGQQPTDVDTARARELLATAVSAVRG
ncbi:MAG: DUF5642 family protein [Mycobacterium sp.]